MTQKIGPITVKAKQTNPVLSAAYTYGELIFTSGRVGTEDDGSFSSSVERQTELAIKNLEEVLNAAGSSLDYILKVLLFIKNPEDRDKINKVYGRLMKAKPARSCVCVVFPDPEVLLELECVAYKRPQPKL